MYVLKALFQTEMGPYLWFDEEGVAKWAASIDDATKFDTISELIQAIVRDAHIDRDWGTPTWPGPHAIVEIEEVSTPMYRVVKVMK